MNTESLQKQFKEVYEQFFAKNDLVVSGCFTWSIWPIWLWHMSKIMRIKTKLPIKLYLWIHTNQTWKIIFWKTDIYDNKRQQFVEEDFNQVMDQSREITEFIKKFLEKNNYSFGVNINILSEWGRGYSFSFSATFATTLSLALHLMVGKLTQKDMESYDDFVDSDIFSEISTTARQIELINAYGNTAWSSKFVLHRWYNPGLFYCEQFDTNINRQKIGDIKYSFTPFPKLFDVPDYDYLPFGYAIIFSWLLSNTKKIEQAIQLDDKRLQKYDDFIQKDILPITKLKKNVYPLEIIDKGIYNQFINILSVLTTIMLESIKKVYTEWEDNVDGLIDGINSIRYLFYVLERTPSDFMENFISIFHEESKNKEKIGMVNCYSSKRWGSYIVLMKNGINRKYFFDTIEKMKKNYPDMMVNYMSWVDGLSSDGVIIEQYVSQWQFSKYITKDQVYVKTNTGENFLWKYNDILMSQQKGLLLDKINNKIYLNGRKLNSKDILSQTTTINILDKLLDNIGEDISNKEFEISSYSKNKNEMIGKIVIPLVGLLEKEFGEKFPLICKGSIYDFYVKLNPTDIPIFIVSKM